MLRKSDRDLRIFARPLIPQLLKQILDAVKVKAAELTASDKDSDEVEAATGEELPVETASSITTIGEIEVFAD